MWWIYSVLFLLLFSAQLNAGAKYLLIATGIYAISAITIGLLSFKYGYGSFHKRHIYSLAAAIIGLFLWQTTNRPVLAILMVMLVDLAGFWLTVYKTWYAPHSETLISWQLALVSNAVSVLAISKWTVSVYIYPIYAVIVEALFVGMIIYRRQVVTKDLDDI